MRILNISDMQFVTHQNGKNHWSCSKYDLEIAIPDYNHDTLIKAWPEITSVLLEHDIICVPVEPEVAPIELPEIEGP